MASSEQSSTLISPAWLGVTRAGWVLVSLIAVLLATLGIFKATQEPLPECTLETSICAPWTVSQEDILLAGKRNPALTKT